VAGGSAPIGERHPATPIATPAEEAEAERVQQKFSEPDGEDVEHEKAELARQEVERFANAGRPRPCRCERPVRSVNTEGEPTCARCGHALAVAA
jgi:hypothetical protein